MRRLPSSYNEHNISDKEIDEVEVGVEDQNGALVVFHAREATESSTKAYEEQN